MCAHSNSKSDYDNCEWKDWSVFIPYSALPHTAGKNDYSLLAIIRKKEDKWIDFASTPYRNFNVTFNNPSTSNVSSTVSDNTNSSTEQVQHTHYSNGGIDIDYYYYSDIKKTQVVTKSSCYSCAGTGVCSFCHGQRGMWMSFGYIPCTLCGGTGLCKQCNATGTIETQYWLDGISGVFSATNNNGTSYSGVVDLYGSSYNSTSSTSSASSKSANDYYEVKEYAPDYTGKQNKVWCEKCRSYDYPHTHVKKH